MSLPTNRCAKTGAVSVPSLALTNYRAGLQRQLRRMKPAAAILLLFPCLVLAVPGSRADETSPETPAVAETPSPGTPIAAINLNNKNIFDTSVRGTTAWPYRLVNALHIQTKGKFIRSLLLFRVGDSLDYSRLAESERLLRSFGFLTQVHITAEAVPEGAAVNVETNDEWTTEVALSYALFGHRQLGGLSLSEQNLLGWGKALSTSWSYNPERTTAILQYFDPLLFGSRWNLSLAYKRLSDGDAKQLGLVYPFYSLATVYSAGADWDDENRQAWLWAGGHKVVTGDSDKRNFRLWGGMKIAGAGARKDRLTFGFFASHYEFAHWRWTDNRSYPAPENLQLAGFQLGWERIVDHWQTVQGFRSWVHQEDLSLGPNWHTHAGVSLPQFGNARQAIVFDGEFTAGRLRNDTYSWLKSTVSGQVNHGVTNNFLADLVAGCAHLGDLSWRGRVQLDASHDLEGDQQLTLGAATGLRGWQPDTFAGDSRALVNLECRIRLTHELLHLFVLGGTVFADAGNARGGLIDAGTNGWRSDAGAGIAFEITRSSVGRIGRLEIAFPDDGGKPVIILSSSSLF